MRKALLTLSAVAIAVGGGTLAAIQADAETPPRLIAELDARTPEAPVNCVQLNRIRGNKTVGNSIAFTANNGTIYINSPRTNCPPLRSGFALNVSGITNRLCSGDIVQVYDPLTGIDYGGCALGDFTPYPRVKR